MIALLVAEAVSTSGTAMTFVALPWFVLAKNHGSAPKASLVLAAEAVPVALFGIPLGGLVSRYGARRVMLVSDFLRAPLIALIPLLSWTGQLTFPLLLGVVFLMGTFTAPYFASQRTILPELFGDNPVLVSKASALLGAANNLPIVIGPVAAGLLIGFIGPRSVLLLDAATYLFSFLTVFLFVRAGRRRPIPDESRGVLAGLRYLLRDRLLGPITLTVSLIDCATASIPLAVPLLAYSRYGMNVHVVAWIFASFGTMTLVGAVLTTKLLDRFRPLRLASGAILLATIPIWTIAFPVPWPIVCIAVAITGLLVPMGNSPLMGLTTTRPPEALRPKVLSVVLTAHGIGQPLGLLVVGPVYRAFGNAGVWVTVAGGMTIGALLLIAAILNYERHPDATTAIRTA
jgi:predicted MFS family arabinose efflux permease